MHYDVFNGDADGIISLLQLRKAQSKRSTLITGVKRDIKLLKQLVTKQDVSGVTVLDISMDKNINELNVLLERDVPVFYCDHHRSGEVPQSSNLTALIDLDAHTCTSLLINQHLKGRFAVWAVAGAFGDNMIASAEALGASLDLSPTKMAFLQELGTLINYNGYGSTLDDLHIPPADLFAQLLCYDSPFDLIDDEQSPYYLLKRGYDTDFANLDRIKPSYESAAVRVYELPCEAWARRVSGVFGNDLANRSPELAHAVLTLNHSGLDFTVSVRAPLNNREGADEVCTQFPTGGGRKAAAGINELPLVDKARFIDSLESFYC